MSSFILAETVYLFVAGQNAMGNAGSDGHDVIPSGVVTQQFVNRAVTKGSVPKESGMTNPVAGSDVGRMVTLLGTLPAGSTTTTVAPTSAATSILVSSAVQLMNVTVKGATSGVQLVTGAVIPTLGTGAPNLYVFMLAGGGPDSSFTVSISPAAGQPAYVWQSAVQTVVGAFITGPITAAGQINVAVSDFLGSGGTVHVDLADCGGNPLGASNPVPVEQTAYPSATTVGLSNPPAGTNWSYALPTAARLVAATCQWSCPTNNIQRTPSLALTIGGAVAGYFTAGTTYWEFSSGTAVLFVTWGVGVNPLGPIEGAGGSYVANGPLPEIMLPAGSVITSNSQNLQSSDQLQGVVLTLSSV